MTMEKTHDIQVLIERFLEGETSLQEESRLYSYFQNENIAPELQEYKEMFLSFDQLQFSDSEKEHESVSQNSIPTEEQPLVVEIKPKARNITIRQFVSIAAIAVFVFLLAGIYVFSNSETEYCEAYIYGKHVTSEQVVMHEVASTLNDVAANNETVDSQLKDAFSSMN